MIKTKLFIKSYLLFGIFIVIVSSFMMNGQLAGILSSYIVLSTTALQKIAFAANYLLFAGVFCLLVAAYLNFYSFRTMDIFPILFISALIFYLFFCLFLFVPERIFTSGPIFSWDNCFHFYDAKALSGIIKSSGRLWGYDPYFMAGYPIGLTTSFGKYLLIFLLLIPSPINSVSLAKMGILLMLFCLPVIIYLSARNLSFDKKVSLLAMVFTVFFYAFDDKFYQIWWSGMFSWIFVSFLSVYVTSLFYKYTLYKRNLDLLFACLFGALLIYAHPVGLLIMSVPFAVLFFSAIIKKDDASCIALLISCILLFILSIPWLLPLLKYRHYLLFYRSFWLTDWKVVIEELIFPLGRYTSTGQYIFNPLFLRWLVIFSGFFGIIALRKGDKRRYHIFISTALVFSFITYFGSYFNGIDKLQPYRFFYPLIAFMFIPSAGYMLYLLALARAGMKKVRYLLLIILAAGLPLMAYGLLNFMFGFEPVRTELSEENTEILSWIRINTNRSARILYQDWREGFPALIPWYINREIIGGPYPHMYLKHSFTNFTFGKSKFCKGFVANRLFSKEISEYTLRELKEYLELYNIKWIFAFSKEAVAFFDKFPDYFIKKDIIGLICIYEIERAPNFFLKGTGNIVADYNKIEISGASRGEIIIKYHWFESLKSEPKLDIEPVYQLGDPVPFIMVKNGKISDFIIFNQY